MLNENQTVFRPIIRTSLLIMLLCGFVYPVATTGIAQILLPEQADGNLIYNENGEVIGADLIGQNFTDPKYFHGRVSSIEYNAAGSGSANFAPSNKEMIQRTMDSVEAWKEMNPNTPVSKLPIDLVTNSASGLDPHISPEAAYAQIKRVSSETGIKISILEKLIEEHTQGRELGLFGEPRVNVLLLNIDLNKLLN